ncbi:MAG: histidinol-phosphatase [Bacteroidetes bacterium]|nr:histidinol-phosphatase [Bacteroidota bacterium]
MSINKDKLLFVDRDGTLIVEPKGDFRVNTLEKLDLMPFVISSLYKITKELGYKLVMVTNQDGLGTADFPEDSFYKVQNKLLKLFANEGVDFLGVHIDKTYEHEKQPTRKPGTAMLTKYMNEQYDLKNSFMVGDSWVDMKLAENLGCKSIVFNNKQLDSLSCVGFRAEDWQQIYTFLKKTG